MTNIALDELPDFAPQVGRIAEVVDANHGEVGHRLLRLFGIRVDGAVVAQHDHPELAGVFNALHENVAVRGRIEVEVRPEEGVRKGDHRFSFQEVLGTPHGVGRSQGLFLMSDVALGAEPLGQVEQFCFDLGAKIPDDEGDVVEGTRAHGGQVFDEVLHNGLSCHGDQWFRDGERVRAEAAASAGHGDDEVHAVPVCPNPPAPRSVMARSSGCSTEDHSTRA